MKHRLHPISFEAVLNHIEQGKAQRVFVRKSNVYVRLDMAADAPLAEWVRGEYHYQEELE